MIAARAGTPMSSEEVVRSWYNVADTLLKMKIHSSCEIEDFVEIHLCKLCVILRSRVLRVVCPH